MSKRIDPKVLQLAVRLGISGAISRALRRADPSAACQRGWTDRLRCEFAAPTAGHLVQSAALAYRRG
jgi:hypothetical protein